MAPTDSGESPCRHLGSCYLQVGRMADGRKIKPSIATPKSRKPCCTTLNTTNLSRSSEVGAGSSISSGQTPMPQSNQLGAGAGFEHSFEVLWALIPLSTMKPLKMQP